MFCKQSKNTFIRLWGDKGYIVNQLTRYDRLYNDIGATFLSVISRSPKEESAMVDELQSVFGNSVNRSVLEKDFVDFLSDLQQYYFVVRENTESECEKNDIDFSYSLSYIKTKIINFEQKTKTIVEGNTYDANIKLDQEKPRLKSIQFELTSRCNERCIHCYIPNSKKNCGSDMTFELFCKIIDQFADMGGLHVSISGGEAFLHKDIIRCIQYCREKDLEICILSNLLALKDEQIPLLKEANLSYIQASLYSMDPQIHDTITTIKGSQKRTQTALEKLIKADIPVQISCPIMKVNKDSYLEVLQFAQKHQIKAFSDYIMMGQADLCTDNLCNRLSIPETEKVIRNIIKFDINYSRWVNNDRRMIETIPKDEYAQRALCGAGINNLCISSSGEVYPCPGWQSMIVGDLNQESLNTIWENSPQLLKIRTVKNSDFPQCLDCEAKNYCSKCLERNSNENNGDMYKIGKHFCDVAFLTKELHEEYRKKGVL